ncbi:MAG: BrnT family toxin [Steroidobacteraceae bacterium]
MEIEFDLRKDEANRLKHGISLRRAVDIEWDTLLARADMRHDYGEVREVGHGRLEGRLHCVVFVRLPNEVVRIISLRRSNSREALTYEREKAKADHADGR